MENTTRMFAIFSAARVEYVADNYYGWTPWSSWSRVWPSLESATRFIELMGWENTTDATIFTGAYVVELTN